MAWTALCGACCRGCQPRAVDEFIPEPSLLCMCQGWSVFPAGSERAAHECWCQAYSVSGLHCIHQDHLTAHASLQLLESIGGPWQITQWSSLWLLVFWTISARCCQIVFLQ
ncbi:hypothetical protein WJX82_011146 [Trebouxia sp. C0006]